MRLALALFIGLIAATPASAQFFSKPQLAKVTEVYVFVGDDVTDGCLPQPNALKIEAELVLRRSGIKITENEFAGTTYSISPVGFAIKGGCAAGLHFQLYKFDRLKDGTAGLVEASSVVNLLVGPKSGFQQQLREAVSENITALANQILKARGQ